MDKENRQLRYKNVGKQDLVKFRKCEEKEAARKQARDQLLLQRRGIPLNSITSLQSSPVKLGKEQQPESQQESKKVKIRLLAPLEVRKTRLQEWKRLKEKEKQLKKEQPPFVPFKKIVYKIPPFLDSNSQKTKQTRRNVQTKTYQLRSHARTCKEDVQKNVAAEEIKTQLPEVTSNMPRPSFAPDNFVFSGLQNIQRYKLKKTQEPIEEVETLCTQVEETLVLPVEQKTRSRPSSPTIETSLTPNVTESLLVTPQKTYKTRLSVKNLMSFTPDN